MLGMDRGKIFSLSWEWAEREAGGGRIGPRRDVGLVVLASALYYHPSWAISADIASLGFAPTI